MGREADEPRKRSARTLLILNGGTATVLILAALYFTRPVMAPVVLCIVRGSRWCGRWNKRWRRRGFRSCLAAVVTMADDAGRGCLAGWLWWLGVSAARHDG